MGYPGKHRPWTMQEQVAFRGLVLAGTLACALAVAGFLSGCGYAKHVDPPLYRYDTAALASESARLHARDAHGKTVLITCGGSMRPLIETGDICVVVPSPFTDKLLGAVVCYKPKWANDRQIVHRLVSGGAADGFIASGDNNAHSEPDQLVGAANYIGEVIAIYRVSP